jgi:hypothetical protein
MPLDEIARSLGFETEPRTELSTHSWADERRMRDDLYRALWPNSSLDGRAPRVVWDALDDDLRVSCADNQPIACFQRSSTTKDPSVDTTSTTAQLVRAKGQHR